ncbi:hypothetical protein [Pedobacter sp. SG908]|uniref:hypothetical protein n=1 Tax=Pedobacter sp. SG908 TaxID=2587135 RepID=UPI001422AAC5|nr:hypothetical protein [Pedobacter sp. SG908]NII83138.1 hypothetical protein [Pedobacter sp. SG908]
MQIEKKHAFLFLTNKATPTVLSLFKKLNDESLELGDSILLYHQNDLSILPTEINNCTNHIFTDNILHELGYTPITNELLPGSNHFPLLDFFMKKPFYSFYWLIEDDVRFSGNWSVFFSEFHNLSYEFDFVSSHITDYDDDKDWPWWDTFSNKEYFVPHSKRVRSFNPVYCLSNSALQFLHKELLCGWTGHHEVLMPTLIKLGGGKLLDFGGNGKYSSKEFKNKFYKNDDQNNGFMNMSTMRYRPVMMNIGTIQNILYHPVKGK